jgi:NhaP-type Na+/H+ or K+/H+ antiporter
MTIISIILGCVLGLALVILVVWIITKLARRQSNISRRNLYAWFRHRQ